MKSLQKTTLILFGVVCLLAGAPLLIAPGSFLGLFGWKPVDPLLSRVLGGSLLGMAWTAWRIFQSQKAPSIQLVELFFLFNALGSIGLLRHLLVARYPLMVWTLFSVLLIFSLLWALVWRQVHQTV